MNVNPKNICQEINCITRVLVEYSISNAQNFAIQRNNRVSFSDDFNISAALKNNVAYDAMYAEMDKYNAFNMKLLDGAFVQMMYEFDDKGLSKHRLAYLPSPALLAFEDAATEYLDDELYLDIIMKNIVHIPIRFDYDRDCACSVEHPASHLTLGQYKNCRIPVKAPVEPALFIDFILRNFYYSLYTVDLQNKIKKKFNFAETIDANEKQLVHLYW